MKKVSILSCMSIVYASITIQAGLPIYQGVCNEIQTHIQQILSTGSSRQEAIQLLVNRALSDDDGSVIRMLLQEDIINAAYCIESNDLTESHSLSVFLQAVFEQRIDVVKAFLGDYSIRRHAALVREAYNVVVWLSSKMKEHSAAFDAMTLLMADACGWLDKVDALNQAYDISALRLPAQHAPRHRVHAFQSLQGIGDDDLIDLSPDGGGTNSSAFVVEPYDPDDNTDDSGDNLLVSRSQLVYGTSGSQRFPGDEENVHQAGYDTSDSDLF